MTREKNTSAKHVLLNQVVNPQFEEGYLLDSLDKKTTKCDFGCHQISHKKNLEKRKNQNSRHHLRFVIQKILEQCAGKWRVVHCGTKRITAKANVCVSYDFITCEAYLTNLQRCGSIWLCPKCAYRKYLQRKEELMELKEILKELGINVYMLTLTVPHNKKDQLKNLIELMRLAKKRFWGDTNSRKLWDHLFPTIGHITSMEITYSHKSGWHPHYHILFFTSASYSEVELGTIKKKIYQLWSEKCVRLGLKKPNSKHGVNLIKGGEKDLFDNKNIMEYIVKNGFYGNWSETKHEGNSDENSNLTIWEIAHLSQGQQDTSRKYKFLFQQYAIATKGERQCFWSKSIRKFLNQHLEKNQKTIPKLQGKKNKPILEIPPALWDLIKQSPFFEIDLLSCVAHDLREWGNDLQNIPRTKRIFSLLHKYKLISDYK